MEIPGHGKIEAPGNIPTGGLRGFFATAGGFMTYAFVIGAILCLFFLLHGGYLWITSGGDKSKIAAARNRIIYAIVGLIVVFLSVFIVSLVSGSFGADLTRN